MIKKNTIIYSLLVLILGIILITNISALSCDTFNPCPGNTWHRSDSPKTVERYDCIDNECVLETKEVECARNEHCGTNERCDTQAWKCVPSSLVPPSEEPGDKEDSKKDDIKTDNGSNYLMIILIICPAILVVLIILAIILRKKNS